jgi:molecular chaperone DnaK (HSP70)
LQEKENLDAEQRIAEANSKAQEAILGQKTLDTKLGEVNLQTEKFKQENIKLSTKYEEERTARLKIEAELAPRRLSGEQEKVIQPYLLGLANKQITLFVVTGNPEVADFAADLERVFSASGLTVTVSHGITFGGGQERGLIMSIGNRRVRDADLVATALRTAKVVSEPIPAVENEQEPDLLQVRVLPK